MTREEFSNMLIAAREQRGISRKDFVYVIHLLPNEISRIENARASYSTGKAFAYLKAVGRILQVSKGKKTFKIDDNEKLIAWEKRVRGEMAKMVFSDSLGFSHDYISDIEAQRIIMSIDKFLKIVEVAGYKIELVKCNEGKQ